MFHRHSLNILRSILYKNSREVVVYRVPSKEIRISSYVGSQPKQKRHDRRFLVSAERFELSTNGLKESLE